MKPIKEWTQGLEVEASARQQLENVASLPVVWPHLAVMPDVHWGMGATVGSVIPTVKAIIPAAVGVDLNCGMMAIETHLTVNDLDGKLPAIRTKIEDTIPVGGPGTKGSWLEWHFGGNRRPQIIDQVFGESLHDGLTAILRKHPKIKDKPAADQLGTLGTGNHFIEVCQDTEGHVWVMLHSGSRGVGNRIATYFIARAREAALKRDYTLPDKDLAWLDDGTQDFADYVEAISWTDRYATLSREIMMGLVLGGLSDVGLHPVTTGRKVVNCHHNYVQKETHFGQEVYLTRKGAVSAKKGELGIIPGSMGAKSFIVRGKGNPESFSSCSHGAGRRMSRGQARRTITVAEHEAATAGVECRKDADVLDESPAAYKDLDKVMAAQADLVDIVTTLKQLVCVKG